MHHSPKNCRSLAQNQQNIICNLKIILGNHFRAGYVFWQLADFDFLSMVDIDVSRPENKNLFSREGLIYNIIFAKMLVQYTQVRSVTYLNEKF